MWLFRHLLNFIDFWCTFSCFSTLFLTLGALPKRVALFLNFWCTFSCSGTLFQLLVYFINIWNTYWYCHNFWILYNGLEQFLTVYQVICTLLNTFFCNFAHFSALLKQICTLHNFVNFCAIFLYNLSAFSTITQHFVLFVKNVWLKNTRPTPSGRFELSIGKN